MAQPSKRSALTTLTRARLLELADLFELGLPRATAKGEIVEALAHSKRASFTRLLDALKREELKEICRAHDLDDGGREKSAIRDRLLGVAADEAPATPPAAPPPSAAPAQLSMLAPGLLGLRRVLELLPDDALAASARHFGFITGDALPARPELITAMVESGLVPLRELFEEVPLDALLALARGQGVDGRVRTRDRLIEALLERARPGARPAPGATTAALPPAPERPPLAEPLAQPTATPVAAIDLTQPRRPSERSVLAPLTRDRLADLARVLGVAHAARAPRDAIVEAIVHTARPSLAALLADFTRDELRAACLAHGLDASDRARGPLADRLLRARGDEPAAAAPLAERPTHGIPRPGDIVRCRHRSYLVEDIVPPPAHREATLVKMVCLDDDAPGRPLAVLWELELGAEILRPEAGALGSFRHLDDPRHFAAYFHAIKWNAVTATEANLFQAPFRAGIALSAYQLIPLMKALELPRANLFIADDVGLGKTIEAGLVLQELLLRQRVEYTLIVCPTSVCLQWQDEMKRRFGLQFEIYDRAFVARRRRQRGFTVNPWATHNRFIISYSLLRRPEHLEPLTAQLGARGRKKTLLILDEAHTVAPASPTASSRYAVDSKITSTIRDGIAPRFENRLFLSATPHNGHSNSFSALLEILDPQRFTRGVRVDGAAQLRPIMVRRLKRDIRELVDRKQFPLPERRVVELTLARDGARWSASDDERPTRDIGGGPALELELADLLAQYTELVGASSKRQRLVFINLQKRLLSSIPAFLRTLGKHAQSFDLALGPALIAAAAQQPLDLPDDDEVDPGDDQLDEADDEAVTAGSRELATPVGRARELLERMTALAAQGRGLPDARVLALVEWIRVHMCPAAGFEAPPATTSTAWNHRRVLIFTESIDTKRYLRHMLGAALRATDAAEDRILELHGAMPEDAREQVQRAFNGDPAEFPVRVLLATDAAREGVNLQGHCADLFHFDIPWNPARMEQRNGRIDRTLQPAEVVRCHYFRYRDRPADHVLATVVRKVETIQRELGSLGAVIHGRVADLLATGGIGPDTLARLEQAAEPGERAQQVRDELETVRTADFQALKKDVNRAVKVLGHSRELLNFNPELLRDTIDVALERLGHGRLSPAPGLADAWTLPPLPDTWSETLDSLRSPRGRDEPPWTWRRRCAPQPVVFDAPRTLTVPQVHLHLHHPFVRRTLGGFLAQGFGAHELQRITVVRDPRAGEVRVLALGRLSLFGRGAARLHDTLIPVVAPWDSDSGPQIEASDPTRDARAVQDLETLLARPASLRPISALRQKDVLRRASDDFAALWPLVRDEANERASEAETRLRRRGELEAAQLRQLLTTQREAIENTLAEDSQLGLAGVLPELERQQFVDDREHMRARLEAIQRELDTEPADLQSLYDVRLRRLEPVGLVYLWPEMMA